MGGIDERLDLVRVKVSTRPVSRRSSNHCLIVVSRLGTRPVPRVAGDGLVSGLSPTHKVEVSGCTTTPVVGQDRSSVPYPNVFFKT